MITIDNFKKLSTSVGIIRHTTNIGFVETDKGLFIIDSGVNAQDGKMIVDGTVTLWVPSGPSSTGRNT